MNYFLKSKKILLVLLLLSAACSNDDVQNVSLPEINQLEVGASDEQTAYIGSDLHIEAEVLADGLVETIEIEMHSNDTQWEFHHTFTEFSGQRNVHFHKHIDIPQEAEPGSYHFHFTVTDQQGQTASEEVDLTLLYIEDNVVPNVSVLSAPEEGQVFTEGQQVMVSGIASDNTSLNSVLVVLVRQEDQIPNEEIIDTHPQVIVMEHTDHFDTSDFYEFESTIQVGAEYDNNITPQPITGENGWQSGNYYIVIVVEDVAGNKAFSNQYLVELTLE